MTELSPAAQVGPRAGRDRAPLCVRRGLGRRAGRAVRDQFHRRVQGLPRLHMVVGTARRRPGTSSTERISSADGISGGRRSAGERRAPQRRRVEGRLPRRGGGEDTAGTEGQPGGGGGGTAGRTDGVAAGGGACALRRKAHAANVDSSSCKCPESPRPPTVLCGAGALAAGTRGACSVQTLPFPDLPLPLRRLFLAFSPPLHRLFTAFPCVTTALHRHATRLFTAFSPPPGTEAARTRRTRPTISSSRPPSHSAEPSGPVRRNLLVESLVESLGGISWWNLLVESIDAATHSLARDGDRRRPQLAGRHGLQLDSLWRIPTVGCGSATKEMARR